MSRTLHLQQLTIGPDGTVARRYFRAEPGTVRPGEEVTKQAYHKARKARSGCVVEVALPVAADPALAGWLSLSQFPGGFRWVEPPEGAAPPSHLEAPLVPPDAAALAGLTADVVARAAHDLWNQKRASLSLEPAPAWEALDPQDREAKRHQAQQWLRVIAHALGLISGVSNG